MVVWPRHAIWILWVRELVGPLQIAFCCRRADATSSAMAEPMSKRRDQLITVDRCTPTIEAISAQVRPLLSQPLRLTARQIQPLF